MLRPAAAIDRYLWHPLQAAAAVTFYGLFRLLPVDTASGFGGWLGRTFGPQLRVSRRARRNIRRAFPDMPDADIERTVHEMWDNLGRTVGEFPHLNAFDFGGPDARVHLTGAENVELLRDDDACGIFYSAHLANWELNALCASKYGLPLDLIYREANNRLVEKLYMHGRRPLLGNLIPKGAQGAKAILGALRQGRHIGMLVDQKMNDGVAVPFFGIDAMTASAIAEMARRFKCPVVGAQVVRLKGARFAMTVFPPVAIDITDDKQADVQAFLVRINGEIEKWIRENPGQWLWLHNRWPD